MTDFESLRRQVTAYKTRLASEQARLEHARARLVEIEAHVQKTLGAAPDKAEEALAAVEAEIHTLTGQVLKIVGYPDKR